MSDSADFSEQFDPYKQMSDEPFSADAQNAIFNCLFVLVDQYKSTMDHLAAVNKACDWLVSLANSVKQTAALVDSEEKDKYNRFSENPK